jgi:uncharacterized membrane protein (DUF485 family)
MDKNQEHLNNLSEIRSIMERSTTFISLSGLSGISAGIIGLLSALYVYMRVEVLFGSKRDYLNDPAVKTETITLLILLAVFVLIITFASTIFFTTRKAKKKGLPVWNSSAKRLVINLFIPLAAGGVFCLILLYHSLYGLIAPSMLMFYGLALLNASKYTLNEIKLLGISELVLGLLSACWFQYGLLFWALGFGVLNIIYGAVMYVKYEK